jgi:hypothetical protein
MAGLSVIGGFIILKFFEYPKKKWYNSLYTKVFVLQVN